MLPAACETSPLQALPVRARRSRRDGFTVVEAAVAGAIIILFLTSLFALNSTVMRILGASRETASASQSLQQRVEQVRLANWSQITDVNWVQSTLLATQTDASVNLPGLQETITVTSYVSPSSSPADITAMPAPAAFTVNRSATGAVTVTSGAGTTAGMASQQMVQIDLTLTWPGWSRQRTRALTTLVSRWGISK